MAGGRIGNVDEVIAGGTLDLAPGELDFAFQVLLSMGTLKLEFGGCHRIEVV